MEQYINLFFSVYLNVVILFSFLTVFFWVVISNTNRQTINNEVVNNITTNLKNIHISNQIFTDESNKYLLKYYEGENSVVGRSNKQLFKLNIAFIFLLFFGLILAIFVKYIICGKGFNWLQVISENLLILIIAGSIEYYFFFNIADKYVPIMPSYLPNVIKSEFDKL